MYVAFIDIERGTTRGPENWWKLEMKGLHVWLGICMLIEIKVLPHRKYIR